jgi:hypothetical protein
VTARYVSVFRITSGCPLHAEVNTRKDRRTLRVLDMTEDSGAETRTVTVTPLCLDRRRRFNPRPDISAFYSDPTSRMKAKRSTWVRSS